MIRISHLIHTHTIRQTAVTLVATVISGVFAVTFYLLLARNIGSSEYGLFTLATTTIVILSTILELGTDRGMIKFISHYRNDRTARLQVSNLALKIKVTVGFVITFFCIFSAHWLSVVLFHQPEMTPLIPLIGIGLLCQQLFNFALYYMQAYEKFFWWGSVLAGTNIARFIFLIFFWRIGWLNAYISTALWAVIPLFGFILGLFKVEREVFTVSGSLSRLSDIFHFNKWVTAFTVASSVSSRLDTYLTSGLASLSAVGVYGLGIQAVSYLPQVMNAIGAVTAPKFASFSDHSHNRRYVLKATLLSGGIALLAAGVMIPGGYVLFLISGRQYTSGLVPYLIVLVSMLVFMLGAPVRDSLLYFYNRPKFFFWASLGSGVVTIVSGLLLIPPLGIIGSALSNLAGQLLLTLSAVVVYRRLAAVKLSDK